MDYFFLSAGEIIKFACRGVLSLNTILFSSWRGVKIIGEKFWIEHD
jgi:hypothetical protein